MDGTGVEGGRGVSSTRNCGTSDSFVRLFFVDLFFCELFLPVCARFFPRPVAGAAAVSCFSLACSASRWCLGLHGLRVLLGGAKTRLMRFCLRVKVACLSGFLGLSGKRCAAKSFAEAKSVM